MSKFEPLKPSRSGDISILVFKISKEAVKQPCLDKKNNVYSQKLILPVYIYFYIKFPGLPPIYPDSLCLCVCIDCEKLIYNFLF